MASTPLFCLGTAIILLGACAKPSITGFSPTYGPPGTEVSVTGTRLVRGNPAATQVQLGSVPQADRDATAVLVKFRVQPGSLTGPIRIRTSSGTAVSNGVFEVVDDQNEPEGGYTFGGIGNVQAANVTRTGLNQPVIMGIFRARWSPSTGDFAFFKPEGDNAFNRMNDFWTEGTFGLTSFQLNYLTNAIVDLPRSVDFYYHAMRQREITSRALPATINLPANQTLTVASDGQTISVPFTAGALTLNDIKTAVDAAIAAADPNQAAPTFTFAVAGSVFRIRTTRPYPQKGKLELSGGAVPWLGFGAEGLYNLTGDVAPMIMAGDPITTAQVTFPAAQTLTITTVGAPTTVNFAAGNMMVGDIVTAIQAAFPGEPQQQPFTVAAIADPLDAAKSILDFRSRVDAANGDHGFKLTIQGTARPTLGLNSPAIIQRYEAETFRGYQAIDDGFTAFANTLPAGTDLNTVFGAARMFVGFMVDDNQLRAHASGGSFDINGSAFPVSWFVGRQSDSPGPVFTHETGHALGFPDLYRVDPSMLGTPPGNWDVMDCSRCDAHSTAWLKSRHHSSNQVDPWIDNGRLAVLGPPAAASTLTRQFILTPVESPWITANPFGAAHPGIEVVQGIELVPTDPAEVYFVENRQKGIYRADHLGLPVDFSTQLPSEGVVMYQGRRLPTSGLATFVPVNLLTPMTNPVNAVNESYDQTITNLNHITIRVLDRITNPDATAGAPSFSYLVQVTWGQGSFYDVAVTPWGAPPWESPDIWVDNQAQNGWGVYTHHDADGNPIENGDDVAVNQDNRLHARIRNLGDLPSTQDFQIIWRLAFPQVAGGEITTELGRVTITEDIPGRGSVISPGFVWRPTSNNNKHVCIKVEVVTVPGELNGTSNNAAQENITQWYSPGASPFAPTVLTVRTQNPWRIGMQMWSSMCRRFPRAGP